MKLFLDSARIDEIKHALEMWNLDGITTNPRHICDSGKPFRQVIEEIADLVADTDIPVSVEVNPHLPDWEAIVREGLQLSKISPNFVIKVGASESGFRAVRELTREGIRVNATLLFSVPQTWHAARAGAANVSPFLSWREAYGDEARTFLFETLTMLRMNGYQVQVIAAAVRNARQIADAAVAGAHCVTAGFAVWQDSFRNPYTTMGEEIFGKAGDATPPSR